LKLLRRILITVVVTLAVAFVGANWIVPVALSFYAAKKAPAISRVVPTDLKDQSMSDAPGKKLSHFGYEFEIPWDDLGESQTKLHPTNKPEKNRVDLRFRSGLRLLVTAIPPRQWAKDLPADFKVSPEVIDAAFGHETMKSDYSFIKALYEFTPDKMNHWEFSHQGLNRDEFLLIIKSIALPKAAETGILKLQNQNYRGFQQGNPQVRQDEIVVDLYSDEGSVEIIFLQKDWRNSPGVTQPEINRIVQSLHKTNQDSPTTPQIAHR
jgi:hypothetical protein